MSRVDVVSDKLLSSHTFRYRNTRVTLEVEDVLCPGETIQLVHDVHDMDGRVYEVTRSAIYNHLAAHYRVRLGPTWASDIVWDDGSPCEGIINSVKRQARVKERVEKVEKLLEEIWQTIKALLEE